MIPVLNEAARLPGLLSSLPFDAEVIVVDGGSSDDSVAVASQGHLCRVKVIESRKGRAIQMNAGAAEATGDILLFLHADTRVPQSLTVDLQRFWLSGAAWGRFDVRLDADNLAFRVIETMMNWRSRLTGIATGDQAIFVKRSVFERVGGYAVMPLMEDIELSGQLRKISAPFCFRVCASTSARRWLDNGIARTVINMWWWRLQYFMGVSPGYLVRQYYRD